MKSKTIKVISFLLTILLIYGIYTETGPFTTIFSLLVYVYMELNAKFMVVTTHSLRAMADLANKIVGVSNG